MMMWLKARRQRTKQKQTALRMMVLSGVVRHGHAEVRYAIPLQALSSTVKRAAIPVKSTLSERTAAGSRREVPTACRPTIGVGKLLTVLRRRHSRLEWNAEHL